MQLLREVPVSRLRYLTRVPLSCGFPVFSRFWSDIDVDLDNNHFEVSACVLSSAAAGVKIIAILLKLQSETVSDVFGIRLIPATRQLSWHS